jgi:hypothetical protein
MDRSDRTKRRPVQFQPGIELLERKQLLSSTWPTYVSWAQHQALLNDPVGCPAVRPNTPALPYGTASKLATYIDPAAQINNGYAVIVGTPSFVAGNNAAILGGSSGTKVEIGDNVTIGNGSVVAGTSLGSGSTVGDRAYLLNSTFPSGTQIAAGAIYENNKLIGYVQW